MDQERIEELLKLGEEVKKREDKMTDIRPRDWMNLDTRVSKVLRLLIEALRLLIEAEDILMDLDDYQMGNGQYYTDFEELYNQLADIREHFADYIDKHLELLTMDKDIDKYFNKDNVDINK